jgi:hypothetical protein
VLILRSSTPLTRFFPEIGTPKIRWCGVAGHTTTTGRDDDIQSTAEKCKECRKKDEQSKGGSGAGSGLPISLNTS